MYDAFIYDIPIRIDASPALGFSRAKERTTTDGRLCELCELFCLLAWFVVDGKAFVGASMIAIIVRVAVANEFAKFYIEANPRLGTFFCNARPLTIHPIFLVSNLGHQSILLT